MTKVWLVSPLIGAGVAGNPCRPQLSTDYPTIGWSDDTARPAESLLGLPTAIIILATCDAAQLAALEADANYYILATEEVSDVQA